MFRNVLSKRTTTGLVQLFHLKSRRPVQSVDNLGIWCRCYAAKVQTKENVGVAKTDDKGHYIERSEEPSKPTKNVPFAKELFAGRFTKEMLVYPEMDSKEDVGYLEEMVAPIERFFEEGIDSKQIDIDAKIPEETIRQLGELGLFGQQIPEEYGGLGLNATGYARLAEVTALDGSIAVTLAAHQAIGLKGILIAGTEAQKQKYLPKLATGEQLAAFALTEPSSGSDAASIQTRATLSDDGKTFHINGSKIWISNGGMAEVFTVFAKTEITNAEGEKEDKVTAFIVERAFGGLSHGKPEDKLGIRGSNTCEVYFDNTPVPIENVIGEVGGGFKIAMNILNSGRFSMGSSGAGIMKKLIGYTAEHAIAREQFKTKLKDFELIKEKFSKMAVTTYAMESMAYLSSQTIDAYSDPDMSLEAAMVKVFSSEACWDCGSECLQVLGGLGYMKTYPYERYLRDARILMIFEGTNEILRMYIALTGCQFAGKELSDMLRKLRNPFNNPSVVFQALKMRMTQNRSGVPPLTLKLDQEVHPQLKEQTIQLEASSLMFGEAVKILLSKHAKKIVYEQLMLKRLADISIDIFAMTACIGRSSRSICIGLKNSEHERILTKLFCKQAYDRVRKNIEQIQEGPHKNGDDDIKLIAETVFQNKGYAAEHPLKHNVG